MSLDRGDAYVELAADLCTGRARTHATARPGEVVDGPLDARLHPRAGMAA